MNNKSWCLLVHFCPVYRSYIWNFQATLCYLFGFNGAPRWWKDLSTFYHSNQCLYLFITTTSRKNADRPKQPLVQMQSISSINLLSVLAYRLLTWTHTFIYPSFSLTYSTHAQKSTEYSMCVDTKYQCWYF